MTKSLVLGTLLLGGCFAVFAQTNSSPNTQDTSPAATQDQTSGTSATDSSTTTGAKTTAHGCLSQGSNGQFMLADSPSGKTFTLSGDTSQLSSNVGNEVQVEGTAMNSPQDPNAMAQPAGPSDSTQASSTEIAVSKVHKISSTCPTSGSSSNSPTNKGY